MSGLPISEVIGRLLLALAAGLIVGYERERHGRAAGLRTTMLVCVSSAMAMILSEHLFLAALSASSPWRPDPARLAAGILTGMGFLGAGSIIRHEHAIRGVTTAAVLWFVTVLGLAIGSGYWVLGLFGMLIAAVTLFWLPKIEALVKNDWYAMLSITLKLDGVADSEIRTKIESMGVKVKTMNLDYDIEASSKTLRCELKFKKPDLFTVSQEVVRELSRFPGVSQVKWN